MTPKTFSLYGGAVEVVRKETATGHSYYVNGKRTVGVTTVLGTINKPFLLPWAVNQTIGYVMKNLETLKSGSEADVNAILYGAKGHADAQRDEAADIGTQIHKWVEDYITSGHAPEMPHDERVIRGVMNFMEWVEHAKVQEWVASEKVVYSKKHNYVGTVDIIAKIGGKLYLIDLKTSNALYPEVRLQTAAYQHADTEEAGTDYAGRWALRIAKETEEQYIERMKKKYKADTFAPFQIFEAKFLDGQKGQFKKDIAAFVATKKLYDWQKSAEV